jgi:hypothetical protein
VICIRKPRTLLQDLSWISVCFSADSDTDISMLFPAHHVMEMYGPNGGKATRILKLGVGDGWSNRQSYTPNFT